MRRYLLGVGLEVGPIREASERLADDGTPVSVLVPRTLYPVLDETLAFIRSHDRTYAVEHNRSGQLATLLRSVGAPGERIESILRYNGLPFTARELVDELRAAGVTR